MWDAEADRFDDQPDHGLTDPDVRRAWTELLTDVLPEPPARILDLGSGTGTLAVLLGGLGHEVTGVDLAPRMIERARRKADEQSVDVRFLVGDAGRPPVDGPVDVVLARHVIWALPDPAAAVDRWIRLLAPGGRLVLVEGRWNTGAGLAADDLMPLVRARTATATLRILSADDRLWGGSVNDERYLITATTRAG